MHIFLCRDVDMWAKGILAYQAILVCVAWPLNVMCSSHDLRVGMSLLPSPLSMTHAKTWSWDQHKCNATNWYGGSQGKVKSIHITWNSLMASSKGQMSNGCPWTSIGHLTLPPMGQPRSARATNYCCTTYEHVIVCDVTIAYKMKAKYLALG